MSDHASPKHESIRLDLGIPPSSDAVSFAARSIYECAIEGAGDEFWEWNVPLGSITGRYATFTAWLDDVHPEDRERFLRAIDAHLDGRENRIRVEYRTRDGRWWHERAVSERDDHEDVVRVVGIRTSVDVRRRDEDRVVERAVELEATLATLQATYIVLDPATGKESASEGVAETFGLSIAPRLSDVPAYVPPSDRDRVARALESLRLGAETIDLETTIDSRRIRMRGARRNGRLVATFVDVTERAALDSALSRLDEQFRAAIESSFDAFMLIEAVRNDRGKIVDFLFRHLNRRSEALILKSVERVIGRPVSHTMEPERFLRFFFRYRKALERREPIDVEEEFESATGRRWYLHRVTPVGDALAISISDITRQKLDEITLLDQQRLVRRIGESSPDVLCLDDLRVDSRRYSSRSLEQFTGRPKAVDLRSSLTALTAWVHPDDLAKFQSHRREVELARDDQIREVVVRVIDPIGIYRWFAVRTSTFARDERSRPVEALSTYRDVTVQRESEIKLHDLNERLAAAAKTDGLTGVNNRREFDERLTVEIGRSKRYGHPLSLVLADIDDFKRFNDAYGHQNGDEALRTFADVLRRTARTSDVVARYGGEEFAVICPETTASEAAVFCERVRTALRGENVAGLGARLTSSYGVAQLLDGADAESSLLARSDQALYRSKRDGKDRVTVATE